MDDVKKSMGGIANESSKVASSISKSMKTSPIDNMKSATDKLEDKMKGAASETTNIGKAIDKLKQTKVMQALSSGMDKVAKSVTKARDKVKGLSSVFERIKTSRIGEKIGGSLNKIRGPIDIAISKAKGMGNAFKSGMGKAKQHIKQAGEQLKQLQGKMASAGKALTTRLTLPIVAMGTKAIHTLSGFDDEMANVQKISGATGKDFDSLRDKAKDLGANTAFSASEASEGMGVLAASGMKVNDILESSGDMFNLMSAGSVTADTAASILTNTMAQFKLEAKDSGYIVDTFAATSAKAKISVDGLEHGMALAGNTLASMNMSAHESTATFGHLANAGVPVEQLGSAVNAMGREVKANSKDFKKLGVNVYDAQGKLRTMPDVMEDLEKSLKGKTNAERDSALSSVFSGQAMQGATAWIKQGSDAYSKLTDDIKKEANAAETMAAIQEDTIGGAFRAVKSASEGMMIEIGDVIKKPIQEIAKGVAKAAGTFGKLSSPMKKAILIFAGIAAAIGPVMWVVSKLIDVVLGIGPAIKGIGAAFTAISVPTAIIVGLVVGLIAVIVHLWRTNEQFRDKVIAIWGSIQSALGTALEFIKQLWETHGESIKTTLSLVFETIQNIVLFAFDIIVGIVTIGISIIQGVWGLFGDTIMMLASSAWETIAGVIEGAMGIIQGIINVVMGVITRDWQQAWSGIQSIFDGVVTIMSSLWSGLVDRLTAPVDALVNIINEKFLNGSEKVLEMWGKVKDFLKNPIKGTVSLISKGADKVKGIFGGSHKTGLNRVPYNDYPANLHKDEMVLTKSASAEYRAMGGDKDGLSSTNNDYSVSTTTVKESKVNSGGNSNQDISFNPVFNIEVKGSASESDKKNLKNEMVKLSKEALQEMFYDLMLQMG